MTFRPLIPAATAAAALLLAAAPAAARQTAETGPVAVIDMLEVFANYDRFEDVREQLVAEIKADGAKSEAVAEEVQAIRATLAQGTYKQDSEDYLQLAVKLKNKETELQAEQMRLSQRYMKKEAELYKQIYDDITKMVARLCEARKYSLVIRYKQSGVEGAEQTGEILNGMNQLVIYHAPQDDITATIIKALDRTYAVTSGKPPRDQKAIAKQKAAEAKARSAAAPAAPRQ